MIGIEDVKRLLTEMSEHAESQDSDTWAEKRDLDPAMVTYMVEKIVEFSHFLCVQIAMNQIAENEAEILTRVDEDGDPMLGVAISMDQLMGSAVFNGFALGWEVARQFSQPTEMPPI